MFKDSVALFPCAAGTITISGESYNMQYASMLALQKSCGCQLDGHNQQVAQSLFLLMTLWPNLGVFVLAPIFRTPALLKGLSALFSE